MQVAHATQIPREPTGSEHFTGVVQRQNLGTIESPAGSALVVTFAPAARTHWHSHPDGQILHVIDGRGRVVNRNGEGSDLQPGDLVITPPDEVHWHGAAQGAHLTHLALSFGQTRWLEEVSGEEI